MPTRPPSGAAGDYDGYKYEWDLANVRSMPVDGYKSWLRNERAYRKALAALQAEQHLLQGGAGMEGEVAVAGGRGGSMRAAAGEGTHGLQ